MQLPEWAPASIIRILKMEIKEFYKDSSAQPSLEEMTISDLNKISEHFLLASPFSKEYFDILIRLITNDNMEKAWKTLEKNKYKTNFNFKLGADIATEFSLALITWLRDFYSKPYNTNTDKKNHLNKIIDLIEALTKEINKNSYTQKIAELSILNNIGLKYIKSNPKEAKSLFSKSGNFWFYPVKDAGFACSLRGRNFKKIDGSKTKPIKSMAKENNNQTLHRFSFWTMHQYHLNITDHLDYLRNELIQKTPDKIPTGTKRTFFTRKVADFIYCNYGQPLDDTVGILVGVILNIGRLERKNIRPYTKKPTGKKIP